MKDCNERVTEEPKQPQEENNLTVEIRQYQTLLEILDKPRYGVRVLFALLIVVMVIFMALAFTTIAIKRIYPYNEIKTNAFGATTMQNEDVELTYWLYNTAEVWANSGIEVEAGDILTIRASGRTNTSIHHLVNAAQQNSIPRYNWVGTEGSERAYNTRTKFRVYPMRNPDALIMQIIPTQDAKEDSQNWSRGGEYLHMNYPDLKSAETPAEQQRRIDRFYYIGKERTDLIILQDGVMHFAVNDIILTHSCIDSLMADNEMMIAAAMSANERRELSKIKTRYAEEILPKVTLCYRTKELYNIAKSLRGREESPRYQDIRKISLRLDSRFAKVTSRDEFMSLCEQIYTDNQAAIRRFVTSLDAELLAKWRTLNDGAYYIGKHPEPICSPIDFDRKEHTCTLSEADAALDLVYPFYNEMTFYKANNYHNAWYEDNIGSFLIVIEKRKK